ncbi:hypothetical protein MAR_009830, partial [Mya arenaria]
MRFERVHRMGQKQNQAGRSGAAGSANTKPRSIVGKFCFFGDREQVRSNSRNLSGTNLYVTEQFPLEVAAKRRRLFRRVKEEKQAGRKAWVSYDTLYVDGKQVKEAHRHAKRNSGGVVIYVRNSINEGIKVVKNVHDTMIWIKLDKGFFKIESDIYLVAVYLWGD